MTALSVSSTLVAVVILSVRVTSSACYSQVILQDLAAMELEEAFDHVDVVVKEADNAKVIVDGLVEG